MVSSLFVYRRSFRSLSTLHHSFSSTLTLPISNHISSSCSRLQSSAKLVGVQSRTFRSTSISLLSSCVTTELRATKTRRKKRDPAAAALVPSVPRVSSLQLCFFLFLGLGLPTTRPISLDPLHLPSTQPNCF
ncbi:unnamed protein product [Vicia faba]|uniref:Uncharacterized protein n=1 Tax=Vicia faba TaxID=3906 RepID=A0AAV1AGT6_VICFA|nr:unnamed protein product [Vicia faba]